MPGTLQQSLFGGGEPAFDRSFADVERLALDGRAWVEHGPGWLRGSDKIFDVLLATADWRQHDRLLYGERRRQPRLNAPLPVGEDASPALGVLEQTRSVLSDRYGVVLDTVGLNLYRDGADSVAWHRDKIAPEITEPVVVIVSLGAPRRFLLRRRGGGRSIRFDLGHGDLLVTGGMTQRTWEHAVPKVAVAEPRISVTMRHSLPGPSAGGPPDRLRGHVSPV